MQKFLESYRIQLREEKIKFLKNDLIFYFFCLQFTLLI